MTSLWNSKRMKQGKGLVFLMFLIIFIFIIPDELAFPVMWVISRSVLSRKLVLLSEDVFNEVPPSLSSQTRALMETPPVFGELSFTAVVAVRLTEFNLSISWLNRNTHSSWLVSFIFLKLTSLLWRLKYLSFKWHFVWVPFGHGSKRNYKTQITLTLTFVKNLQTWDK